jgi:uncharacterized protein YdiU (UPF0061 family)
MASEKLDFTLCFRRLYDLACNPDQQVAELFEFPDALVPWLSRWRQRLDTDQLADNTRAERMAMANPAFIARNHLVEEAIRAGEDEGDFGPFFKLIERLSGPGQYNAAARHYASPPLAGQEVAQTFCGT